MATSTTSSSSSLLPFTPYSASIRCSRCHRFVFSNGRFLSRFPVIATPTRLPSPLHVIDESKEMEVSDAVMEISDPDKLVDGMDFGELCNEFVCISSPLVEATARQLIRDVLELREGNRALGSYAISVKYKDPLRTFVGREKYKRALWATNSLEKPTVTVQEMKLLSIDELSIKWTLRGKPKNSLISTLGGDLVLQVNSKFVLNQISGQVMEHTESWDLSTSSILAQGYFWVSRRLFSANEAGKDTIDSVKSNMSRLSEREENMEIYPDPSGDPTKFFQQDNGQQDIYQIAIFLAIIYFVVQFLRSTI